MDERKLDEFAKHIDAVYLARSGATVSNHGEGKYALTFVPHKRADWVNLKEHCRESGVTVPDNMLVERADGEMHVTLFWGMTG
jgi:hypothetical protein